MHNLKTIDDLELKDKKVLLRVEFNVKVKEGKIKDDTRIRAAIPTIEYILERGGKLILMAHLGRPQDDLKDGKHLEDVRKENTMEPVAEDLSNKLGKKVRFIEQCIGEEVENMANQLKTGEVMLIGNLRFYREEEENNKEFARSLAKLGDIYVNDAFGAAHRWHASIAATALEMLKQNKPVAIGFLMKKELELWNQARSKKGHKMLVIGGAKLNEKIKAVDRLSKSVDAVLIGGAVYNAIRKGQGSDVGDSLTWEKGTDYAEKGKEIAEKARNLLLSDKVIIAKSSDLSDRKEIAIEDGVPQGYIITDIVIDAEIEKKIGHPEVAIIFGPTGMFDKGFDASVKKVTKLLKGSYVIVGGGESVDAYKGLDAIESTGGGAAIKLYTKGTLEALEALKGNTDYS